MGKANPPHINNPLNECLHLTIALGKKKLHLFLVYIHPHSRIEETILVKAALYDNAIIIGDFNANQQKNKQINNFIRNSIFEQIPMPSTFIMENNPSSTPDVTFCTKNYRNNIKKFRKVTDLGSDHLGFEFSFDLQRAHRKTEDHIYKDCNKCNHEEVNSDLTKYITQMNDINTATISEFLKQIAISVEKHTPSKARRYYTYTLPPYILRLIKIKRQLYREIRLHEEPTLKRKYNEFNKCLQKLIQDYKESQWVKTCEEINDQKGRLFWQQIKKVAKYRPVLNIPDLHHNNQICSTDQDKANLFAQNYKAVYEQHPNKDFCDNNFKEINNCSKNYFKRRIHFDAGQRITMEE